ncbi:response regulator [Rhodoplanes sp. Z2-YC6860]|uniref:response regulator n=1 Tax=Rhodoplanes sp. Z2-YC6860 TaxID=674703 RepID=UPI00078C1057|nr:response regulator [Rhodoplanes sp. Z2-YC6860]AMN45271.1 chemotaxis protein CheY [Rhodoplanes sp. Z2-YC6860]
MPLAMTFKVLVVDDQLTMREVTRLALQEMGVRLIIDAENGDEAFKKATTQPLDMIISDFNMPGMDGLALLRAVRGHPAVRKLPFILVTGRGDNALVVSAAQAGVNNYIVKPFTAEMLREKVEAVVGKLS